MGCMLTTVDADRRLERLASCHIDNQIAGHRQEDLTIERLLLLGTQNSGKSTLFRQCALQYGQGITKDEKLSVYRPTIQRQAVNQMLRFGRACLRHAEKNRCSWSSTAAQALSQLKEYSGQLMSQEQRNSIDALWKEKDIRDAFFKTALHRRIGVPDSSQFFWNDIHRLGDETYEPTNQDCLFVRKRTFGIEERSITIDNRQFTIIDVDGHESQRKKWFQHFDNVRAIIWVTSLMSCFETVEEYEYLDGKNVSDGLEENTATDGETSNNAMQDALNSFEETINSEHFESLSTIVFLNKVDLFAKHWDLNLFKECFNGEYHGSDDCREAANFVADQFNSRFKTKKVKRYAYIHHICCTDTSTFLRVFNDVQHVIINLALRNTGLIP